MSILANIILYSSLAGVSTILGIWLVRHFEHWAKRNTIFLISFAVGVLLANAFFSLLPESIKLTSKWPYWTLGTIALLYLIEHLIIIHSCREEECDVHNLSTISLLGIGFHSLIDGITIAIAFQVGFVIGLLVSLAVIFHEIAEGVFTYTLLIHDQVSSLKALFYSWLVALATPLGAILTYFFLREISSQVLGWLLAAAAGSFIYIGASDLVPATHKKYHFLNIFLLFLGIVFVLLIRKINIGA